MHLKLTSMALPSVSNEIMCDPLGDTATHWISVRFSDGNVAHDDAHRANNASIPRGGGGGRVRLGVAALACKCQQDGI